MWEGVLAMPLVYLNLPGNYLLATLLAGTLAVDPVVYGGLVSLPFWCNFLQLFITPHLAAHWSARRIFLGAAWANNAAWLVAAGLLVWMAAHGTQNAANRLAIVMFFACLATSLSGVAWTGYVQSWVPQRIRGVYFAQRNRMTQVSNLVFLLVTAAVLHWLGTGLLVFAGLFTGAFLLRVTSLLISHSAPVQGDPPSRGLPLAAQVDVLRRDVPYLRFLVAGSVWGFTANFVSPFYPMYLLRELEKDSSFVGLFYIVQMLFGAMAFPAWGRLVNRHGSRPVLLCAIALWAVVNAGWVLVTRQTAWLPHVLGALAGATNAAVVLGQFNLVLKLVPPNAKALAIAIITAVMSLATAIAPLASGWLLARCLESGWDPVLVYRSFFLSLPALAGVTWYFMLRLREPDTASLERVVGAMRNLRTLGAVLGLGFVFSYLFEPRTYSRLRKRLGPDRAGG